MSDEMTVRPMPEHLKKMRVQVAGGKLYLPAAFQMEWFRSVCPDWGVSTELLEGGQAAGFATVRAVITNEQGRTISSGMKTETKQDFPAGWVEKAETGAIARALKVAGFASYDASEVQSGGGYTKGEQSAPRGTQVQQGGDRPPKQADQETVTAQKAWFDACERAGIEDEEVQRITMAGFLSNHFTEINGTVTKINPAMLKKPTVEQYRIAAKELLNQLDEAA